jgi:hypothetical protein
MNFEETQKNKKDIGEHYESEDGLEMRVFITPKNEGDFQKYMEYYKNNSIDDEVAKTFSSDSKFLLRGINEDQPGMFISEIING